MTLIMVMIMMTMMMLLLLLLSARASAAARGGAISLLACAETQVLALRSPGIELAFIGFCGVFMRQPASYTVHKDAKLSISHRSVRCFPMCVAFRIGFCGVFADSRLFAHASLDLHLSFSSVRGGGGL